MRVDMLYAFLRDFGKWASLTVAIAWGVPVIVNLIRGKVKPKDMLYTSAALSLFLLLEGLI